MPDKFHLVPDNDASAQGDSLLDQVQIKRELEIPNFDELLVLAEQNPTALEQLRAELCDQLIHNAPEYLQNRLRGIQFSLDLERKKTRSHYARCMKLSEMLHDSLSDLSLALTNPEEYVRSHKKNKCEVIPLFPQ